jgi:hypothetical protein
MTTPTSPQQARADRQALIDAAVAHMDATGPDDLTPLLTRAGFKPAFQRDPNLLRNRLTSVHPDDAGPFFAAYKAAQRLLHAAGMYRYPR